ncbi:MAG: hypothetical protein ACK5SQ_06025 [Chitinophagales bacterium]|jgi:hypothetical protein
MKHLLSILIRAAFTFVAFLVIQYQVPYYLLAAGGLAAGFFMLKTGEDRTLSIGILTGSVAFGVFAFVVEQMKIG